MQFYQTTSTLYFNKYYTDTTLHYELKGLTFEENIIVNWKTKFSIEITFEPLEMEQ